MWLLDANDVGFNMHPFHWWDAVAAGPGAVVVGEEVRSYRENAWFTDHLEHLPIVYQECLLGTHGNRPAFNCGAWGAWRVTAVDLLTQMCVDVAAMTGHVRGLPAPHPVAIDMQAFGYTLLTCGQDLVTFRMDGQSPLHGHPSPLVHERTRALALDDGVAPILQPVSQFSWPQRDRVDFVEIIGEHAILAPDGTMSPTAQFSCMWSSPFGLGCQRNGYVLHYLRQLAQEFKCYVIACQSDGPVELSCEQIQQLDRACPGFVIPTLSGRIGRPLPRRHFLVPPGDSLAEHGLARIMADAGLDAGRYDDKTDRVFWRGGCSGNGLRRRVIEILDGQTECDAKLIYRWHRNFSITLGL